MNRSAIAQAISLLALTILGCSGGKPTGAGPSSPKTGASVAHVGDELITADEVKARLSEQAPYIRPRYADPAAKKEFLDNMIKVEVFAQEALREGLDKNADVQAQFKRSLVSASLVDPSFKKQLSERFLAESRSKRLESYYQELKKTAHVTVDDQALAAVEVPNAPGGPGHAAGAFPVLCPAEWLLPSQEHSRQDCRARPPHLRGKFRRRGREHSSDRPGRGLRK